MKTQTGAVSGWIKSRFPFDQDSILLRLQEPVPNHLKRWWWCLGGMPAYLFVVQVVTGIILAFYYVPDPARAYESVWRITYDIPLGWWIRALHKWSANLMIVTLILHTMRVFFTGAFRAPRELNWIFGAVLLILSLVFGFTGYSLVYEQLAYWGATVATNLTEAVPYVGVYLARFIRGGDTVGADTLSRFFIFHIGILPTLVLVFLSLHILMVRTHGVTELHFKDEKSEEGKTFRFFPDHIFTELIIGLGVLIVISAISVIFPMELQEKADPLTTPAHIKPEWYFYFTFRWLKLAGLTVAVFSLGAVSFIFVFWPFFDKALTRLTKKDLTVPLGILAVLGILVLTLWEALAH
ncbi:MAG: cytochrome bc complex cytochrome b subunit [Proteobacteria bacterium]|nr:cytochrome bc complex cytochrome b subunit [Pseudomonadota bacterium]